MENDLERSAAFALFLAFIWPHAQLLEASAPKSQKAPADSGDQNMLNNYLDVNMIPVNHNKSYCLILLLAFIVFDPSLFYKW